MNEIGDPRFGGLDFERSFLRGVIYDDESLTLEMDFNLTASHPRYTAPEGDEGGCYRSGYVRFSGIQDLRIDKAPALHGGQTADYSVIHSVSGDGDQFAISTGWGNVNVSARSIRVTLD